jgi:hypothetical protein
MSVLQAQGYGYLLSRGWLLTTCLLVGTVSINAAAADYRCPVTQKFDEDHQYTSQQLSQGQFSVLIEQREDAVYVSRCGYAPSVQKVTCDRYAMDKVVRDPFIGAVKYYLFQSQFDVQVFSNLTFIENNGRGGIAYGQCEVIFP